MNVRIENPTLAQVQILTRLDWKPLYFFIFKPVSPERYIEVFKQEAWPHIHIKEYHISLASDSVALDYDEEIISFRQLMHIYGARSFL